jgi:uncharacterized hydrophobic protein (TIGR00271 family)
VDLTSFIANAPVYLAQKRHVVTLLESVDLGPLLQCAHEYGAKIGLLPVHAKSRVCRLFGISPAMEDAMPLALQSGNGVSLDLLLCNDEIVTWMVTLGDVPFIELRQIADQQGLLWQHVKAVPTSLRTLFGLQPKAITVTTAKDTKMKTAIIGAIVIENDIESLTSHFANQKTSPQDGNLSVVLVAPSSIMDYLSFLATALSPLPHVSKAIGFIKTKQMTLESDMEIDYHLDGQPRSARQLTFRILPQAVTVNVGEGFATARQPAKDDKDILKVQTLPQGEERLRRLKQSLPLFSTAQDEDFKDTFAMLRDYARLSVPFSLLMALSAMLATLGLFLNSAPVVIGAMVLAPLMGPLVSLAMGILRNNDKLLKSSLQVFAIGTGLTLLVAALTALLLPYEQATNEIRARLQPNLLDLGVAIVSGIAAAYAHARENIQKSLPGIAIAVALVPPACVMGVGVGWMNWAVISGAGLLFLTNLIGITLAGIFTFLFLGFAPAFKVNRGLGVSLLLTVLVSIPLYQTFMNTVVYQRIEKTLSTQTYLVNSKLIELSDVSAFPSGDKIKILGQLHSSEPILAADIATLRDIIGSQLDKSVVLDVSLRLVQ